MALTTAQLNALCRLRAERRREQEEIQRQSERQTAGRVKTWAADTRAMIAGIERTGKALTKADRETLAALAAEADREAGDDADHGDPAAKGLTAGADCGDCADERDAPAAGSPRPAKPEPLGAGVPELAEAGPPGADQPLNRRERRALASLRRKRRRR
jgi:hypothetical protein